MKNDNIKKTKLGGCSSCKHSTYITEGYYINKFQCDIGVKPTNRTRLDKCNFWKDSGNNEHYK